MFRVSFSYMNAINLSYRIHWGFFSYCGTWNSLNSNSQSTGKAHKGERAINE